MKNTRKMVFMAILTSLSVVLGYVDAQIGVLLTWVPFAKIGLANIIILLSIIHFSFRDTFLMALLKSLLLGLILSAITTFFIGFSGTMLSFLGMYALIKYVKKLDLIFVSVVGGLLHSIGQIMAVVFLYNSVSALVFAPQLMLASVITGVVIGMLTKSILRYVKSSRVFDI